MSDTAALHPHVRILAHALGIEYQQDRREPNEYRNHYVCNEGEPEVTQLNDEDCKPLKITKREARREALVSAAAVIDAHYFNRFDGDRIDEDVDSKAWSMIDTERHRIVQLLCKWAKWDPQHLGWEQDR